MFKTRGPITPQDDPSLYIYRQPDNFLAEVVHNTDYAALIGPRMSGKTSMLMHLHNKLNQQPRYIVSYTSMSTFTNSDESRWYDAVYNSLVKNASQPIPPPNSPLQDVIDLRDELLDAIQSSENNRIFIFMLDDVEAVPMDIRTPFFATLREIFVSRGIEPVLRRVAFVLGGSYIPDQLIPDASISPFRVAEKIYLDDSQYEDLAPLLTRLNQPQRPADEEVTQRIFEWTEGDLYLTQRICAKLHASYPAGPLTRSAVDQIVERYLYDDEIYESLESRFKSNTRMRELIEEVVIREANVRFTRTNRTIAQAWLLGCIKTDRYGNCIPRNAIYHNFITGLVKRLTPLDRASIRPRKSETHLLHGYYQLENVIKRNVLTHIYRAIDHRTGKTVAIKQLLSMRGGDIIAWKRFLREGEALKLLDHPNIITLIDSFQEGDYNYIVMEYVNGGTLDTLMNREGRQPIPVVLDIMIGVTDALAHTHARSIIHRDLKPSNILLTQDLSPRLADFGVAYFAMMSERLTATDMIVGTPAYLCPEGYSDSGHTPAEDIWSVGVTLYELLTGVLPFRGRTHDHIRYAVQNDPIPDVRNIRPDTPAPLAQLIYQMLERSPKQRIPDGKAAHNALLEVRARL